MGMIKQRSTAVRLWAVAIMAAVAFAAASWHLQSALAQSPRLDAAKPQTPLPKPNAKSGSAQAATHAVSNGQILKTLLLTGELKAARSTSIAAPNIRSSFSNTVSFIAPEGTIVKKGGANR